MELLEPLAPSLATTRGVPLVDHTVLTMLECMTGADTFSRLVGSGLQQYGQYCAEIAAHADAPDAVRRAAHALKGSAGSIGLQRVGAIAGQIEADADDVDAVRRLLGGLQAALRDSRAELVTLGMLQP